MGLLKYFDKIVKREAGAHVEYFVMNKSEYIALRKKFLALDARYAYVKRRVNKAIKKNDTIIETLIK